MRFCYLHFTLLASLLAATAPADSTNTKSRSATLHEMRSRPSDRDAIAAMGASSGDENRVGPIRERNVSISRFVSEILLHDHVVASTVVDKWSEAYDKMVRQTKPPHEAYKTMVIDDMRRPLLASPSWRMWALFASDYSTHKGIDPHEYIVAVMSKHYGGGRLTEILAAAAGKRSTMKLAHRLQEVQMSFWLRKQYPPQEVFNLLRIRDVWENNLFMSPRFATWTRYLERVCKTKYENDPAGTEIRALNDFIEYGHLLKILVLPKNASHPKSTQYLQVLNRIGLDEFYVPYQIVSMLLEGVKKAEDQFTLLFMYGPTKHLWMLYVKEFNKANPLFRVSLCTTLRSAFDLPELFTMLRVAVNAPDEDRSRMALLVLSVQFAEWKKLKKTTIAEIMQDGINIPSEISPVVIVTWQAYIKFYLKDIRPSRADFIM